MPQLSLTDFVDVISASGTPKATKVKQIKNRPAYSPATDFYKRLRENIVEIHRENLNKDILDSTLSGLTDKKKETAYPAIISGYKKWWGKKQMSWFEPPNDLFSSHGVDISVNPELGLEINGTPHLIKLYFKSDPLTKNRIDIITHLMAAVLGNACPPSTEMSVLDIRRSKLISPTVEISLIDGIIDAELAYISALWSSI
ncbi:hypothetical protein [Desulfobacter vibrioformis]|uniref:hypothetical protein n=1 Tax=Desulfobacter vibrioformis TaxID=34031 RepID=UPI000554F4BE|nr:hypothetical protein [Desulfobacter vibrioformis]